MKKELKLSNNTAKLHKMFGKKLYASKYSFIAEICQNAVDSHRMSGQKEPVILGIKHEPSYGNKILYIRDNGLSFKNQEDFINKICTILESGKSENKTNDEDCPMGMHGIGSISVSAYQPKWRYTVVTPDNKKFTCELEEIEGKGLTYQLSECEHTDEDKYVLFEVEVEKFRFPALIDGMKSKLCYFKDIMFEFDDRTIKEIPDLLTLNSTFKIFESDDFKISTISPFGEMHIILDQYAYPIRWEQLGMVPIKLNIGLSFLMGDGLEADITRENLILSDNYKSIILDKIQKVSDWFITKYNSTLPEEYTSVAKMISFYKSPRVVTINNNGYNIESLIPNISSGVELKEPAFKGVSKDILRTFIAKIGNGRGLFYPKYYINSRGMKVTETPGSTTRWNEKNAIFSDEPISSPLMKFIKTTMPNTGIYSKRRISLYKGTVSIVKLLNLCNSTVLRSEYHSKGINLWRQAAIEFNILRESAIDDLFIRAESISIPANIATEKKKAVRKQKISLVDMTGEIGIKYAAVPQRSIPDWNCKFVEKTIQINTLHRLPFLHIYGSESNRHLLDALFTMVRYNQKNNIKPCIISEKQQSVIEKLKLHNFMNIEEFFKGKHDTFRRIITGYIIRNLYNENKYVFDHSEIIKEHICLPFAEDVEKLKQYMKVNGNDSNNPDRKFMDELVEIAKAGNMYDLSIWHIYNKVKLDISKFDFIQFFTQYMYPTNSSRTKAITAMTDIARERKIRMNWKNYKILEFENSEVNKV